MRGKVLFVVLLSLLLCVSSSGTQVVPEDESRPFITADEPDFPSVSGLANVTYLEGETGIWITWAASDTSPASYYIKLDGVIVSCRPWNGSNITYCADGLTDGVHKYTCVAIDAFNRSGADDIFVTVLDGRNPIVSHPDDVFVGLGSSVLMEWQIYDRNPSNYSLFVDDGLQMTAAWTARNETVSFSPGTIVTSHKYSIRAVDKSGHYADDAVFVYVDTQAPTITSPSDIEYLEGTEAVSIVWTVEEMFPYDYTVTRDGATVFRGPWDGSDIIVDVGGLSEGVYSYELTVTDESGLSDTDTVQVTVLDGAAPIIARPDDITLKETGQLQTLAVLWDVFDTNPYWYTVTFDYFGPGYVLVSSPWDGSDIFVQVSSSFTSGEYLFTLTLVDERGYVAVDEVSLTVILDAQTPIITSPSDIVYPEGTEGMSIVWSAEEMFPYGFTVTRNDTVVLQGSWDGSPIVVDISGLLQGVYYYELSVTDESGLSDTDTVKVTVLDGAAPAIAPAEDLTIRETGQVQTLTLLWEVSDANPYWYTVTFDYYRPGYVLVSSPWDGSDILLRCWDNFVSGKYKFTLTVLDEQGLSAEDQVFLTVILDTQDPVITGPSDMEFFEGTEDASIVWVVEETFPHDYTVTRDGMTVFRGPWVGSNIAVDVSSLASGVYLYELTVTDESGLSDTDAVMVTVLDATPPTVSSPDDITIKESGYMGTVFIVWSAYDANPYWYSVWFGRGVSGATVDEGPWDGSDIYLQHDSYYSMGEYVFVLTLIDENGNSASDEVALSVVAGWPLIGSPFDVRYTEGEVPPPINWSISDSSSVRYEVLMNDTVIARGSLNGNTVVVDVSGLSEGTYMYEIRAWNTDGLYASDPVTVNVDKDVALPAVDSPPDVVFFAGTAGMSITWTCSDLNPYSYEVTRNETVLLQTSWKGLEVEIRLDGLKAGVHEYALTLSDINGNDVTDTVLVTVLPLDELPPVDTGLSLAFTGPALLAAGAVCGAVAVAMLYRMKKN